MEDTIVAEADSSFSDIEVDEEYESEEGQDEPIRSPTVPGPTPSGREEAIASLSFDIMTTEAQGTKCQRLGSDTCVMEV